MRIMDMVTQDFLDILSTSPHYFCRKCIGSTNENSNFDLRVSRVNDLVRGFFAWTLAYWRSEC